MIHYVKFSNVEPDSLAVVPGVVGAVEVRHVGRGPVRRRVPRVVCHPGGLKSNFVNPFSSSRIV